jgi:uncharacterized membrane protein YfcA
VLLLLNLLPVFGLNHAVVGPIVVHGFVGTIAIRRHGFVDPPLLVTLAAVAVAVVVASLTLNVVVVRSSQQSLCHGFVGTIAIRRHGFVDPPLLVTLAAVAVAKSNPHSGIAQQLEEKGVRSLFYWDPPTPTQWASVLHGDD